MEVSPVASLVCVNADKKGLLCFIFSGPEYVMAEPIQPILNFSFNRGAVFCLIFLKSTTGNIIKYSTELH